MTRIAITDCDFGDGDIEASVLGDRFEVVKFQAANAQEVIAASHDAEGLFVQWARIDETVLRELPSLRAIVRYGIGLDNIDLVAANNYGVAVSNVDDYCIDEVANHAASKIVAGSRRLWEFGRGVRENRWAPSIASSPVPPQDDAVGIAGMGRIGRAVATRVAAWGYPAYFWDPLLPHDFQVDGVTRVFSLVELAERVNHLSLHVPLLEETVGLVNREVLGALGPEGHLINVSRGPLVDEVALLEALDGGTIARASLDVFVDEPPGEGSTSWKISQHQQVLATPHVAYLSTEALRTLRRKAASRMLELVR